MIKRLLILLILLVAVPCSGDSIYIDPDCTYSGDGTTTTCGAAAAQGPFKSWIDAETAGFSASHDYYQKCATTDTITAPIDVVSLTGSSGDRITFGAYYGSGTIGVSGAKPIIVRSGTSGSVFDFNASTYVFLTNLDLRGGDQSMYVDNGSDNFRMTNCVVGYDAGYGVRILASDDGEIYNNIIDSNNAVDSHNGIEIGSVSSGYAGNGWSIYQNKFYSWSHTHMLIGAYSSNNEVYYNYGDGTDCTSNACRGFGVWGANSGNVIRHNYWYNYNQHSQLLQASNVTVYGNVFDTIRDPAEEALDLSVQSSTSVTGNKIYNNTFYNLDDSLARCIRLYVNTGFSGNVYGNEIINNVCLNYVDSGVRSRVAATATGDIYGNTFRNNIYYLSGETQVADWKSADLNITEWNAINGTDTMTIIGELNADPSLSNPAGGDFWPSSSASAVYQAGYDVGAPYDTLLLSTSDFTASPPSVLTDQFANDYIGAYGLVGAAKSYPFQGTAGNFKLN